MFRLFFTDLFLWIWKQSSDPVQMCASHFFFFLTSWTCRRGEVKVTPSSSLIAMKSPKSLRRRWTITSWEKGSSNVSNGHVWKPVWPQFFRKGALHGGFSRTGPRDFCWSRRASRWPPNRSICAGLMLPLVVGAGHVIPPEKVHEKLFVGSNREFKKPSHPAVARYNKKHTAEQVAKMKDKLVQKEFKLRKRLAAEGIDYDFPGFVSEFKFVSATIQEPTRHHVTFGALFSFRPPRCLRRKSPPTLWMCLHVVT